MSSNIVLWSANPHDLSFAGEIASRSGLSLRHCSDVMDVVEEIRRGSAAAILVDADSKARYEQLENGIQERIGLFSDQVNANQFHFISSEDFSELPWLSASSIFGSFVLRPTQDPLRAADHYARVVVAFQKDRAFGLAPFLGQRAKIQTVKLQYARQKQEAVEAVRGYLIAAKFNSRNATAIANAVDETLMNAIFDAPVDAAGKHTLSNTPRTADFPLEGRSEVEMQIGFDGDYIGIAVADLYGSVDRNKLAKHIGKSYGEEEYKVKLTSAGAGLGLSTIHQTGGSYCCVCEQGNRTEATLLFRRTETAREFKEQFRFFATQFYF